MIMCSFFVFYSVINIFWISKIASIVNFNIFSVINVNLVGSNLILGGAKIKNAQ